jgi:hypothetical protein
MVGFIQTAFSQEMKDADTFVFQCTVLYPETAGYPEVSVVSDTVKFKLFYVDDGCSGFTYRLLQKDDVLSLQRTTSPPDTCTTDEQILYGVEGFIANMPKGEYLFELQTGATEKDLESIFREWVTVKK